MKIILFVFLMPFWVFAQYTVNDSDLVRTAFTREFNKEIINQYLSSEDPGKIKAALYTISHSNDTTFVQDIIKLDYDKYREEICFVLGQLGPNTVSEGYLLSKLNNNSVSTNLLQALGKCGSQNSFDFLIQKYNESDRAFGGISLALYYFNLRDLLNKEKALPVILRELRNQEFTKERQADAAFAVYRTNLAEDLKEILSDEIKQELRNYTGNDDSVNKLYYMLGSIRLIKFFPDDKELFYTLQSIDDYILKVESAKALAYYTYKDKNDLLSYLRYFNDNNPNVTRAAAAALKDLKLNDELKSILKNLIEEQIITTKLSGYTKGELLISYISLFNPDYEFVIQKFQNYVYPEFVYRASEHMKTAEALNYLMESFYTETNKSKLLILQSLINYQSEFRGNTKLEHIFIESINSGFAPVTSIAADGVDSLFIEAYSDTLPSLIIQQVNKDLNNADFIEAMFSLYNLSVKTDTVLSKNVLSILKNSEIFSIRKFALDKTGNKESAAKDSNIFASLWRFAFKYSSAEINTTKDKIKIKFLPQYAPVSVGNFCSLSFKRYYNNNNFHRVVPAFVIQGGDITETGWGGPGYDIISEFSDLEYRKGMVGMASAGKDTEGSQWFITTGYYPHLNSKYTIFADVEDGMENVNLIDQDDEVISIKLIE
ncbi:MAG: peptidylprolyl isomerase [Ignavibacteriaceae bacterium]